MELRVDSRRIDFRSPYDWYYHRYLETSASPKDLAKLLKVRTRDDAIEFLDSCGPLYRPDHFERIRWKDRRPSELTAGELDPLVGDVENTLNAMTVALRAFRLLKENVPVDKWPEYGFVTRLHLIPDDNEDCTWMPEELYGENVDNCTTCHYTLKLNSNGTRFNYGISSGRSIEGGKELKHFDVFGISEPWGDCEQSSKQALQNLLDRLLTKGLGDISISSVNTEFALKATEFNSYLWLVFMECLSKNDIRYCYVCGEPFVANMGQANERGSNPKSNCSSACRALKVKAEKAKKLIESGMEFDKAASEAHISIAKLKRYLRLHPIESGKSND